MTPESVPNDSVIAVVEQLDKWAFNEVTLVWWEGNQMDVKIDLSRMTSEETAGLIQRLIDQNWSLDEVDIRKKFAKVSGPAHAIQ